MPKTTTRKKTKLSYKAPRGHVRVHLFVAVGAQGGIDVTAIHKGHPAGADLDRCLDYDLGDLAATRYHIETVLKVPVAAPPKKVKAKAKVHSTAAEAAPKSEPVSEES